MDYEISAIACSVKGSVAGLFGETLEPACAPARNRARLGPERERNSGPPVPTRVSSDCRWLNNRNTVVETLDEARSLFSRQCSIEDVKIKLDSRPPIANPQEYLRPFVEFLRREADDPLKFLLRALADHRVVILGEVHHRPRYWAFNSSLVRDKAFAERAGVIYMELPGNDQPLVEKFLAAPKSDPQPIIEMLRDELWVGWPAQAMLDFFKAVWEVNPGLPSEPRLRIVLTDTQCPWKDKVDRDQVMAENVLRDLREHSADLRHALFIVGYGHAWVNLTQGGEPMKSAGWRLREKLGDTNVFAVFPHSPVVSNDGGVNGRIALGLFETAFAALVNRPMCFPLDHGPFGEQVFDASMDDVDVTADPFRNGYQAYLYLGPLDEESVSPLIPGYVTDDFAKELDRRYRLMYGKSLVEVEGGPKSLNAQILVQWYKQAWGQPRLEWSARSLGPLRAWEWGSDWQKKLAAAKLKDWWPQDKEVIRQSALRLFEAIRQANYEDPGPSQTFPAPDVDYQVYMDYPSWVGWICQHFRTNPIVAVDLGGIRMNTNRLPALPYKVTL